MLNVEFASRGEGGGGISRGKTPSRGGRSQVAMTRVPARLAKVVPKLEECRKRGWREEEKEREDIEEEEGESRAKSIS